MAGYGASASAIARISLSRPLNSSMMTRGLCPTPMRRSCGFTAHSKKGRKTFPPPSRSKQERLESELGADLEVASLARNAQSLVGFERRPGASNESKSAGPHGILAIDEVERIQRLEVDG